MPIKSTERPNKLLEKLTGGENAIAEVGKLIEDLPTTLGTVEVKQTVERLDIEVRQLRRILPTSRAIEACQQATHAIQIAADEARGAISAAQAAVANALSGCAPQHQEDLRNAEAALMAASNALESLRISNRKVTFSLLPRAVWILPSTPSESLEDVIRKLFIPVSELHKHLDVDVSDKYADAKRLCSEAVSAYDRAANAVLLNPAVTWTLRGIEGILEDVNEPYDQAKAACSEAVRALI